MAGNNPTPASLRMVRLALLGGVVIFGGVVFFIRSSGSADFGDAFASRVVMVVVVGACVAAAAALIAIRSAQERSRSFTQKATLGIMGWAVGESAALVGGVHWLLSGVPTLFLLGLAVFLLALLAIPVPEDTSAASDL